MKHYFFIFTFIFAFTILIFSDCSNDDEIAFENGQNKESVVKERTISLIAEMPNQSVSGASSRIALNRDENNKKIVLNWESGDIIDLLIYQESTNTMQLLNDVGITIDPNNSQKAQFQFSLPSTLNGDFTLFGVYGGGGLLANNPRKIALTSSTAEASLSNDVKNDMVLYFSEDLNTTNLGETITVSFAHLGAIFNVNLKNIGTNTLNNIKEVRITSTDTGWPYNTVVGTGTFDLLDKVFVNTSTGNYLGFTSPKTTIMNDETLSFYGWYPSLSERTWPELNLELVYTDNTTVTTALSKPAKSTQLMAGKNYVINTIWNGVNFLFDPEPKALLTTTKTTGETITLRIDADDSDQPDCWIDLNNDGEKNEATENITFGSDAQYTVANQEFTIYGNIKRLDTDNNNLTAIDVSWLPNLIRMECQSNQLSSLDIINNPKLQYLECDNNGLDNLNITNNLELEYLSCNNNNIPQLDVSSHTKLNYLTCANAGLTSLTIGANTGSASTEDLKVNCSANSLTTLDVSANTKLKELNCQHNRMLETLLVSNTGNLRVIKCYHNKITGTNMTGFVNSLPTRTVADNAQLTIINNAWDGESNTVTPGDIAIAQGKMWKVFDYNNDNPIEYPAQ